MNEILVPIRKSLKQKFNSCFTISKQTKCFVSGEIIFSKHRLTWNPNTFVTKDPKQKFRTHTTPRKKRPEDEEKQMALIASTKLAWQQDSTRSPLGANN